MSGSPVQWCVWLGVWSSWVLEIHSVCFLVMVSHVWPQEGTKEGLRKTKSLILMSPKDVKSLHAKKPAQPIRWKAESEDLWASAFTEGQSGIHKERQERISVVYLNVTRLWLGEGRKNLQQRPTLSYLCIWSPGQGTACLWECWGSRKEEKINNNFKKFTIQNS